MAKRGLNLVIVARRDNLLSDFTNEIQNKYGVEAIALAIDLSSPEAVDEIFNGIKDLDIGIAIYNAALSPIGNFSEVDPAVTRETITTNRTTPTLFSQRFLKRQNERGMDGLIVVSSLSGYVGSPRVATYAATKAYLHVLSEGLWGEVKDKNISILTITLGAISTPGLISRAQKKTPGQLDPAKVVDQSLSHLEGGPTYTPGLNNKIGLTVLNKILPRSFQ
ncbi:SDR family NAD(P)-dependent oxidoreductase [Acidithrix sp. C25]|uniref:SDR family NAD(P)-dependent oxidoreductase n=1 Tax=Acidithrix sp. C25 TaxID=1671482 RepID=UPI00191B9403|nr:SDR family NAD(P)-dependent oxidoreductase [Acidithrix sp. C25]